MKQGEIIHCDDPSNVKFVDPDYKQLWTLASTYMEVKDPEMFIKFKEFLLGQNIQIGPVWFIGGSSDKELP